MKVMIATAVAISALAGTASADKIFICNDRNMSLQFNIYEDNSGIRGGNMYLEGIQVASLSAYRMNSYTIRAQVDGNTASTEFILNADREAVYVTIGDTVTKVCSAIVRN